MKAVAQAEYHLCSGARRVACRLALRLHDKAQERRCPLLFGSAVYVSEIGQESRNLAHLFAVCAEAEAILRGGDKPCLMALACIRGDVERENGVSR